MEKGDTGGKKYCPKNWACPPDLDNSWCGCSQKWACRSEGAGNARGWRRADPNVSWRLWETKRETPSGSHDPLVECWEVLELGAVGQAVRHQDVLVEVVGSTAAVAAHLVNHLANG